MAVTYKKQNYDGFELELPVLHKVVYAHTEGDVLAMYQRSYQDHLIDEWLKENCRGKYYHGPGYTKEKFIQFEDDQDAFWFSLRWS